MLSAICRQEPDPPSGIQGWRQSFCKSEVLPNHLTLKEALQKISGTFWHHQPSKTSILDTLSSDYCACCTPSLSCFYAWAEHSELRSKPYSACSSSGYYRWRAWVQNLWDPWLKKLDKRRACKLLYLVQWSGYEGTNEETSWILANELGHASNFRVPSLLSWQTWSTF
jgi:hypothetical protein